MTSVPLTRRTAGPARVYLGAYTGDDAERGIGVARVDDATGALRLDAVTPAADPSFLALASSGRVLYAVHETGGEGRVSAFSLDRDGGITGVLGSCPSGGGAPCHLSVHPAGRHLFTANYATGTVGVVTLAPDGAPLEVSQVVRHVGSGPDPDRQEGPHAHMVLTDPAAPGRVLAVDLGTDSVHGYAFDAARGRLTRERETRLAPGSGPRHLALHPVAGAAYVLGELDSTLTACAYDRATGALTPGPVVSLLPAGVSPAGNMPAEVLVSSDGRFVYASNRGHDSVAVFAVTGPEGTGLRLLGHHPCGGRGPRHLSLDPEERWMFVANQDSGSVAVLARDPATGALAPSAAPLPYPEVVCVLPKAPVA